MKIGLHNLIKIHKAARRRGRGIGSRGAKSGRGMKGQKARAGYSRRLGFEGGQTPLYQRLPKARGAGRFYKKFKNITAVTTDRLDRFKNGSIVALGNWQQLGLMFNKDTKIKLIDRGKVSKKITVRVHAATAAAIKNVENAGGKVELIENRNKENRK